MRREFYGAAREVYGLFAATRDGGVMSECIVDVAVMRTDRESSGDFGFVVAILKVVHRGAQRMGFERVGVDRQRFFERDHYVFTAVVSFVERNVEVGARAVWVQLKGVVEKLSGVSIAVFFREQLAGRELRFEIIGIGFDRGAIQVVCILVAFEMDQRASDRREFRCGLRIVVGVVLDERSIDRLRFGFVSG